MSPRANIRDVHRRLRSAQISYEGNLRFATHGGSLSPPPLAPSPSSSRVISFRGAPRCPPWRRAARTFCRPLARRRYFSSLVDIPRYPFHRQDFLRQGADPNSRGDGGRLRPPDVIGWRPNYPSVSSSSSSSSAASRSSSSARRSLSSSTGRSSASDASADAVLAPASPFK